MKAKSVSVVTSAWDVYEDAYIKYAHYELTQEFLDKLSKLSALCRDNQLQEVQIECFPHSWGPKWAEEQLLLLIPRLVINESGLMYFEVQTDCTEVVCLHQRIDELQTLFDTAEDGSIYFLGPAPDDLQQMYEEDMEISSDDESEKAVQSAHSAYRP